MFKTNNVNKEIIEKRLQELREKWKTTIGLDRKLIEIRAKLLKKQLEIL